MDSCVFLAFLLLLCSTGAASAPEPPLKSVRVGDAVTLPVTVPKGQSVTNLILRDTSREKGVAIWMDSKDISVVDVQYSDRVAFLEDEMAFRITNLSLDDGGTYEISTGFSSSTPTVLNSFLLAVFNISERISSLLNDSCYVYLDCKAGMGSGHKVSYAWKDTEAGTTLSQEAKLTQLVHANQKRAYTCTAQSPTAQSAFDIVLQHLCIPNTASPGPWALLGSLLVRAFLVPILTAILLLL